MAKRTRRPSKATSCTGKVKYSKIDAISEVHKRRIRWGGIYNAYRCMYGCKLQNGGVAWHVGHIYSMR